MKDIFPEDEVVTTVTRLTQRQLVSFVENDLVRPQQGETGYIFRRIDIARLELLCDLSHDLDLDETALAIAISLIDQLHAVRRDLATIARAIDALPAGLQNNVMTVMKQR